MNENSTYERQLIGCGFEPRLGFVDEMEADVVALPGRTGDRLAICPGYLCGLPEVVEASYARSWKSDGQLAEWLERRQSTPALRRAITELEVAQGRADVWAAQNPVKRC